MTETARLVREVQRSLIALSTHLEQVDYEDDPIADHYPFHLSLEDIVALAADWVDAIK